MGGRVLGDFEVVEEIGAGETGTVYRARQVSSDRTVALKVLASALAQDEEVARRFADAARTMMRLRHPHIVEVIAVGEEEGTPCFAMEHVVGGSVAALLDASGRVDAERAAEWATQAAEALGYAHEEGVIHGDVRPENLLIDRRGEAKVTDFGIARAVEKPATAGGSMAETPDYTAPEVLQSSVPDGRADVYSLGAVLYEMVTGRLPFPGPTPLAVAMRHVTEAPTPPHAVTPEVPEWLSSVIMQALAKRPADRFGTAREMAANLRAWAAMAPSAPSPPRP